MIFRIICLQVKKIFLNLLYLSKRSISSPTSKLSKRYLWREQISQKIRKKKLKIVTSPWSTLLNPLTVPFPISIPHYSLKKTLLNVKKNIDNIYKNIKIVVIWISELICHNNKRKEVEVLSQDPKKMWNRNRLLV